MGGMRTTPPGVHRERVGSCVPPLWYVIWLGEPGQDGSARLGRSKRLPRHLWHRFFPERADVMCRDIQGWVAGVEWLLELHRGLLATSDSCTVAETESVRPIPGE